jgi:hypothetical protein
MSVKKKMLAETARFGMWNSLDKNVVLSIITKMSLGQSGEVDRRQMAKYPPPESLKRRHQLAKTFFGSGLRRITHASCWHL